MLTHYWLTVTDSNPSHAARWHWEVLPEGKRLHPAVACPPIFRLSPDFVVGLTVSVWVCEISSGTDITNKCTRPRQVGVDSDSENIINLLPSGGHASTAEPNWTGPAAQCQQCDSRRVAWPGHRLLPGLLTSSAVQFRKSLYLNAFGKGRHMRRSTDPRPSLRLSSLVQGCLWILTRVGLTRLTTSLSRPVK